MRFAGTAGQWLRFWSKVKFAANEAGCWLWTAALNTSGYGHFQVGTLAAPHVVRAHRWSFEVARGPIPEGMVLDHLCRNRACVNPSHLEVVTNAENSRRQVPHNSLKTACPKGHPYDEANTKILSGGRRDCRTCVRVANRASAARRRAMEVS